MKVVTGAFGFSGRSIARKLIVDGDRVITLTGHPRKDDEFGEQVTAVPFNFDKPDELVSSLKGATVLYNTYWIRFAHGQETFEKAVENTRTLIHAAREAGVRRVVHVSITNPSLDSSLPYFSGKAKVEKIIEESGLSYAILRPAVIFGDQGILINNIAWFIRHLPVFATPGDGEYSLQPVFVDDLAALAVEEGAKDRNVVLDAVGPEVFTFNELLDLIGNVIHRHIPIIHINPKLLLPMTGIIGGLIGDVVLTRDEIIGLMDNLLISGNPPTCPTRLSDWLSQNSGWVGTRYMSELRKHFK
ncbi:MAG: SDR family oxidoreductase [Armatimonadota bacterium]